MKTLCKPSAIALALITLHLSPFTFRLNASFPLAWEVRPGQPAPVMLDRYHGETLSFAATFRGFGELPFSPDADIRLWYQTNGMGRAWWSVPATVQSNVLSAVWSPALDPGADRVSLFFGAPSNAYASAVLRLRHSPGFAPGAMPDPESFHESDPVFAAWLATYTPPDTSLEPATNYTHSALGAFAATGTVARAGTYGTPTRWTDATGCVWEVMLNVWVDHAEGNVFRGGTSIFPSEGEGDMRGYLYYDPAAMEYVGGTGGGWYYNGSNSGGTPGAVFAGGPDATSLDNGRFTFGNFTNLVSRVAYTNDIPDETDPTVPEWAKEPSPPSYSAADVGAAPASIVPVLTSVSNDAVTAKLNAETALRIVLGESVWFAVTNYMRTVEGVIPSLQLWEVRGSATNLVYDSREEITNTVRVLTSELRAELEARIPSKAWGNYQSDGTDNPQPGEVAIVNQPTVLLTGGGTFNKYLEVGNSSVWVLTSSGLCSFGGDTNGNFFAVLDDEGKAHFKVSKTDSFDVGAICNGIFPRESQNSILCYFVSTNRQGQVYASPPVLSASTNLQETVWHEEVDGEVNSLGLTVSWERNDAISAWVATITPDAFPPALFLRAKVKQEGGVAVINTAPTRFDGGIQIDNGTYRLVPYTTGGKTYLTVETIP